MIRILGLDYGERRIGVAVSDALGITAQPVAVIERKSLADDMLRIGDIIRDNQVSKVVIGLPLNMDGTSGKSTEDAKTFGDKLALKLSVPVEYIDERLTTMQADRMLIEEADMSREKRKKVRDKIAATFILQAYLDQHGSI